MEEIKRSLDIPRELQKNKVLVIYGPRQVGKTTIIKSFLKKFKGKYKYYVGDDSKFGDAMNRCELAELRLMFEGLDLLVIDEAQKITNIGRAVKLVIDNIENIKVVLTGSSSFDLANRTGESLTGRKHVVTMYPVSQTEMLSLDSQWEVQNRLSEILIYGSYPAVLMKKTGDEKSELLRELADSYLLKDILAFDLVKNSNTVRKLLQLLAFQVGSEVSLNELANSLDIDKNTVARYIDLLEKSFVIFSLGGFSRNLRKEVYKSRKYYFYDLGIRNVIISNLNSIDLRDDIGKIWENFLMIERVKRNEYTSVFPNYYFWRTYDGKEIDLIEEIGGRLDGYEFKWNRSKRSNNTKEFLDTYEKASLEIVVKENYFDFVKYSNLL